MAGLIPRSVVDRPAPAGASGGRRWRLCTPPPHPGETLREDVLPALGINVTEMAHRLGLSQKTLIQVLHERAPISSDLAVRLERAGIGRARSWLAVQGDYEVWQVEHRER